MRGPELEITPQAQFAMQRFLTKWAPDSESEAGSQKSAKDPSLDTSTATNGDGHANRFGNRSLARTKIKRDGLKAGTSAPDFRLPRRAAWQTRTVGFL
jgi:hypothetical protein